MELRLRPGAAPGARRRLLLRAALPRHGRTSSAEERDGILGVRSQGAVGAEFFFLFRLSLPNALKSVEHHPKRHKTGKHYVPKPSKCIKAPSETP